MEIDSSKFIRILNTNFDFPIVNTGIGNGIQVDARAAFLYSLVVGAGYLDNPIYPFSLKGLMKVFHTALDYRLVTGLFDNTTLKNTPYLLSKAKPYLFSGNKVIIPIEFKTEIELQKKLEDFAESENNQTDYLIQRIECSKRGNGMEPFMEYLACETMKRHGYIVENQIPLSFKTGSPDFAGYILPYPVPAYLNRIHLIELALIRLGYEMEKCPIDLKAKTVVGEAKTGTMEMKRQLDKYIATNLFNEAYEIHPFKKAPSSSYYGLITIDNQMRVKVIPRKKDIEITNSHQKVYFMWLANYIKYYLIANLTNDEFNELFLKKMKRPISSKESIIEFINKLEIEDILKEVIRVMQNGAVQ